MITQERLKQLLHYDPDTGLFTRIQSYYKTRIGKFVGTVDARGYIVISVAGKPMLAHRLAWLYVYGAFPPAHLDHINGDTQDNRLVNLRSTTAKQNVENQKLHKNNKTGYRGVCYHEQSNKYRAYIKHNRKQIYIGSFDTAEEASAAYKKAQNELHTHHHTSHAA